MSNYNETDIHNETTTLQFFLIFPRSKICSISHCRFIKFWSQAFSGCNERKKNKKRSNSDISPPLAAVTQYTPTHCLHSSNDMKSPAMHLSIECNKSREHMPRNRSFKVRLNTASFSIMSIQTVSLTLVLLTLFVTLNLCMALPCDSTSWWDPVRDKCIECTICHGEMIPLRPCQLHRDTICGSIYDLKIDWVVLAKTEPNWKERRKSDELNYDHQYIHDELQQLHEQSLPIDWQTGALFLAVLACLIFFIVAACILIHHMRQWRRMERRLDRDVEELSSKLMAKLAEVQNLEGGTFFIGNADALQVPSTFPSQHVLLPKKPSKQLDRRIIKALQPGNVYIEGNGGS